MKRLLCFYMFTCLLFTEERKYSFEPATNFLICDYMFTNQDWTIKDVDKFLSSYSNNKFTRKEKDFMIKVCKENKINFYVLALKLEQENGLVRNYNTNNYNKRLQRAMAYGLYIKKLVNGKTTYPYFGFENQITLGVELLRTKFNEFKSNTQIGMVQRGGYVTPINAATYSLYRYCPVYGFYDNMGVKCMGNRAFILIDRKMRQEWKK